MSFTSEIVVLLGFSVWDFFLSLFLIKKREDKKKEEREKYIRRKRKGVKNRRTTESVVKPGFQCKN